SFPHGLLGLCPVTLSLSDEAVRLQSYQVQMSAAGANATCRLPKFRVERTDDVGRQGWTDNNVSAPLDQALAGRVLPEPSNELVAENKDFRFERNARSEEPDDDTPNQFEHTPHESENGPIRSSRAGAGRDSKGDARRDKFQRERLWYWPGQRITGRGLGPGREIGEIGGEGA